MEITGVGEAAQFINVSINGAETVLKLTGSFVHFTGHELKELIKFFMAQVKSHKLLDGELSISEIMKVCNKEKCALGCMQIDSRIKDEFIKFCKDNKLTYSFLLDVNKNDTYEEVLYKGSQVQVFETFMASRYPLARPYTIEEYKNNATIEGFFEAESLLDEALELNEKMTPVVLEKTQITGIDEESVEIVFTNEKNEDNFITLPKERLKQKDDKFIITVADKDFVDAYDKSAYISREGRIVKSDAKRNMKGQIRGEYLSKLLKMNHKAPTTNKPKNVIDFPGKKR